MTTKYLLTLACICLLQSQAEAKPQAICKSIDEAISTNEEYVESILEGNPQARIATRKAMTSLNGELGKALSPEAIKSSAAAIAALDAASAAGNEQDAMLAALQNYAVLVDNFKTRLPTSQNVAMLDHAGFSLQALANSASPDWGKVKAVQSALAANVKAIDKQLGKGPLADLVDHTRDSIDAAISQSDSKWLNASAQILLDSVDLVEAVVKNKSLVACH